MDVATITMPKDEAKAKLQEYRDGLAGREPTEEDRGIILGLQAIEKGKSLLDLHAVFRSCPADAKGRPALAIARAHWRHCWLKIEQDGRAHFSQTRDEGLYGRSAWHRFMRLPPGTMPESLRPGAHRTQEFHYSVTAKGVVPLIRPKVRPAKALLRYFILWEAEWEPVPPTDPMLLRHLCGSLYVVLASWDLTPLERAVLTGRLTEVPRA